MARPEPPVRGAAEVPPNKQKREAFGLALLKENTDQAFLRLEATMPPRARTPMNPKARVPGSGVTAVVMALI